eukprot:TRINITY_DN5177_c0_g1_i1.p1 TRINITY_DN5177_c0_g1~~TRINITY_DN5177_c0_g1_i1.p1  ORF type:complete len:2155 (+),score=331.75 TRINITY_DN5177_c0_g1_i1:73-6537(+)
MHPSLALLVLAALCCCVALETNHKWRVQAYSSNHSRSATTTPTETVAVFVSNPIAVRLDWRESSLITAATFISALRPLLPSSVKLVVSSIRVLSPDWANSSVEVIFRLSGGNFLVEQNLLTTLRTNGPQSTGLPLQGNPLPLTAQGPLAGNTPSLVLLTNYVCVSPWRQFIAIPLVQRIVDADTGQSHEIRLYPVAEQAVRVFRESPQINGTGFLILKPRNVSATTLVNVTVEDDGFATSDGSLRSQPQTVTLCAQPVIEWAAQYAVQTTEFGLLSSTAASAWAVANSLASTVSVAIISAFAGAVQVGLVDWPTASNSTSMDHSVLLNSSRIVILEGGMPVFSASPPSFGCCFAAGDVISIQLGPKGSAYVVQYFLNSRAFYTSSATVTQGLFPKVVFRSADIALGGVVYSAFPQKTATAAASSETSITGIIALIVVAVGLLVVLGIVCYYRHRKERERSVWPSGSTRSLSNEAWPDSPSRDKGKEVVVEPQRHSVASMALSAAESTQSFRSPSVHSPTYGAMRLLFAEAGNFTSAKGKSFPALNLMQKVLREQDGSFPSCSLLTSPFGLIVRVGEGYCQDFGHHVIRLAVGTHVRFTHTLGGTLVQWDQEFVFPVEDPRCQTLLLTLYNTKGGPGDGTSPAFETVGCCNIQLNNLPQGKPHPLVVPWLHTSDGKWERSANTLALEVVAQGFGSAPQEEQQRLVEVTVVEAKGVPTKNTNVTPRPLVILRVPQSDAPPYVALSGSPSCDPTFGQSFQVGIPGDLELQLDVEIYDTYASTSTFIGRATLALATLPKAVLVDRWLDVGSAFLRLKLLAVNFGVEISEEPLSHRSSVESVSWIQSYDVPAFAATGAAVTVVALLAAISVPHQERKRKERQEQLVLRKRHALNCLSAQIVAPIAAATLIAATAIRKKAQIGAASTAAAASCVAIVAASSADTALAAREFARLIEAERQRLLSEELLQQQLPASEPPSTPASVPSTPVVVPHLTEAEPFAEPEDAAEPEPALVSKANTPEAKPTKAQFEEEAYEADFSEDETEPVPELLSPTLAYHPVQQVWPATPVVPALGSGGVGSLHVTVVEARSLPAGYAYHVAVSLGSLSHVTTAAQPSDQAVHWGATFAVSVDVTRKEQGWLSPQELTVHVFAHGNTLPLVSHLVALAQLVRQKPARLLLPVGLSGSVELIMCAINFGLETSSPLPIVALPDAPPKPPVVVASSESQTDLPALQLKTQPEPKRTPRAKSPHSASPASSQAPDSPQPASPEATSPPPSAHTPSAGPRRRAQSLQKTLEYVESADGDWSVRVGPRGVESVFTDGDVRAEDLGPAVLTGTLRMCRATVQPRNNQASPSGTDDTDFRVKLTIGTISTAKFEARLGEPFEPQGNKDYEYSVPLHNIDAHTRVSTQQMLLEVFDPDVADDDDPEGPRRLGYRLVPLDHLVKGQPVTTVVSLTPADDYPKLLPKIAVELLAVDFGRVLGSSIITLPNEEDLAELRQYNITLTPEVLLQAAREEHVLAIHREREEGERVRQQDAERLKEEHRKQRQELAELHRGQNQHLKDELDKWQIRFKEQAWKHQRALLIQTEQQERATIAVDEERAARLLMSADMVAHRQLYGVVKHQTEEMQRLAADRSNMATQLTEMEEAVRRQQDIWDAEQAQREEEDYYRLMRDLRMPCHKLRVQVRDKLYAAVAREAALHGLRNHPSLQEAIYADLITKHDPVFRADTPQTPLSGRRSVRSPSRPQSASQRAEATLNRRRDVSQEYTRVAQQRNKVRKEDVEAAIEWLHNYQNPEEINSYLAEERRQRDLQFFRKFFTVEELEEFVHELQAQDSAAGRSRPNSASSTNAVSRRNSSTRSGSADQESLPSLEPQSRNPSVQIQPKDKPPQSQPGSRQQSFGHSDSLITRVATIPTASAKDQPLLLNPRSRTSRQARPRRSEPPPPPPSQHSNSRPVSATGRHTNYRGLPLEEVRDRLRALEDELENKRRKSIEDSIRPRPRSSQKRDPGLVAITEYVEQLYEQRKEELQHRKRRAPLGPRPRTPAQDTLRQPLQRPASGRASQARYEVDPTAALVDELLKGSEESEESDDEVYDDDDSEDSFTEEAPPSPSHRPPAERSNIRTTTPVQRRLASPYDAPQMRSPAVLKSGPRPQAPHSKIIFQQ